jgi:hypothetical protein
MNSLRLIFNLGKVLISRVLFAPMYYYGIGVIDQQGYLSYIYNGKRYLVQVVTQGPAKFFTASEGDEDVTMRIDPFAGPKRDFYGLTPTPSDLGYEELTFFTPKGYRKFSAAEPIVFDPREDDFE